MWCPSVSLSVWANAWLAGAAAPDDVLDALSQWAPRHSVTAYDSVAAGPHRPALAGPDRRGRRVAAADAAHRGGPGRHGAHDGRRAAGARRRPRAASGHTVPARRRDRRARRSSSTGRSLRGHRPGARLRIPGRSTRPAIDSDAAPDPCALSWTVYSVPGATPTEHLDLGEAEYALRSAVRSAADALGALHAEAAGADIEDPRGLVEAGRWNPSGSTAFPTTPRHGRCGCWRTRHTSTRSSR